MIKAGDLFYFVNRNDEIEVVAAIFESKGVWHFRSEKGYAWDNYSEKEILEVLSPTRAGAVQMVIDRLNKSLIEDRRRFKEREENLSGNIDVMKRLKESAKIGYDAESDKSTAFAILKKSRTGLIEKGLASLKSWGVGTISMSDIKDEKLTITIDMENE